MTSSLLRFAGSTVTAAARRRVVASSATAASCSQLQWQFQPHSAATTAPTPDQRRFFWMDVVRIKKQQARRSSWDKNRKDGNNKNSNNANALVHEDPEQVVRRHTDEVRADGEALLDLMFFNDRHEKAWMKRKRLQNLRRYEFDKKHVTDLAKYIAFVQDYGNDNEGADEKSSSSRAPQKGKKK